jgi:hypothetical protein
MHEEGAKSACEPKPNVSELSDAQSEDRSQATNLLTQVHRGP